MWFGKLPSGPKHQKTRIYHLASNWDGMCGPNMLLNTAQSAPEANFLSKIPKVPKLPQLGRISKIPKITKLPKRPSSKICFRSCRGRDFLKISIIRGCENLRGTLCGWTPANDQPGRRHDLNGGIAGETRCGREKGVQTGRAEAHDLGEV